MVMMIGSNIVMIDSNGNSKVVMALIDPRLITVAVLVNGPG